MKKKIMILIAVLSILIITELIIRLTWSKSYVYTSTPLIYQCDSIFGYTYMPNVNFCKAGGFYKINNQGYIGNDFSTSKKKGIFRIAFVGSCIISGALDYKEYSNCCTTIQELFNKNHWNVEVLNCGVDGNNRTFEIFKSIEYKILKFDPDIIICENLLPFQSDNLTREIYKDYILEYDKQNLSLKEKYKSMINNFHKYKLLFKLIDNIYIIKSLCIYYINRKNDISKISEDEFIDLRKNKKDYLAAMLELYLRKKRHYSAYELHIKKYSINKSIQLTKELIEKLKKQETKFFYFKFSNKNSIVNNDSIPIMLLNPPFNSSMFYDYAHLNPKGNETLGRSFYNIIIDNKLIPTNYLSK